MRTANVALLQLVVLAWAGTPGFAVEGARVKGKNIRIEFDGNMHSRVVAVLAGQERVIGDFSPLEFIRVRAAPCPSRRSACAAGIQVPHAL
jgi:hypothetical protein